jgi:hypothetical protein
MIGSVGVRWSDDMEMRFCAAGGKSFLLRDSRSPTIKIRMTFRSSP